MHHLPPSTVRLITSTQVITSANSVVKELLENSLDAGTTSVEIKLDNYGLDKIEVRDNGCGVCKDDVVYMAVPHYTSKLTSSEDLENLSTYGFRGEALGSLCSVSDVTIITKTKEDDISTEYLMDHKGLISKSKPSHLGQGTTISASNIFKNLPVRKQFHNNTKRKKETLKQIEDLVMSYSVICPSVRFVLRHNKDVLWQSTPNSSSVLSFIQIIQQGVLHRQRKNAVASSKNVLHSILGSGVISQLRHIEKIITDPRLYIEAYLPCYGSKSHETGRSNTERSFIYVNSRPVVLKGVEKLLKQYYSNGHSLDQSKYPVGFLHIKIPSKEVDVNVDPNKTKVMLHSKSELHEALEEMLSELYSPPKTANVTNTCNETDTSAPPLPNVNDTCINDVRTADVHAVRMETTCDKIRSGVIEQPNKSDEASASDIFSDDVDDSILSHVNMDTCTLDYADKNKTKSDLKSPESGVESFRFKVSIDKDNNNMEIINESYGKDTEMINENMGAIDLLVDIPHKSNKAIFVSESAKIGTNNDQTELNSSHILNSAEVNVLSDIHNKSDNTIRKLSDQTNSSVSNAMVLDSPVMSSTLKCDKVKQPDFNVSGDFDDILAMDIDTPVKSTVGVTSSVWCKGTIVADKEGGIIQPVQLLTGSSSDGQKPSGVSPAVQTSKLNSSFKKNITGANSPGQATLYDMVGSIKRPTTAYIYFSKEIRPQVVQDNPGSSFQDIAKIIGDKWKLLSESERKKYEELMTKDVERYREQRSMFASAKVNVPAKKRKTETDPCVQKLFTSNKNCLNTSKQQPTVKTVTVKCSIKDLKKKWDSSLGNTQQWNPLTRKVDLLGQVESSLLWVVLREGRLCLFQPVRAKELLIYNGLLESHALPLEMLDTSIVLTKSMLSNSAQWQTLMSMKKTPGNCFTYYTDDRMLKNGFNIRQYWDQATEDIKIEIESMTNCMNFYGIKDLIEILDIVSKNTDEDGSCPLSECRSVKVQHYLQGEAVRMSRKLPQKFDLKDCSDLLDDLHDISSSQKDAPITTCFHNKPFLLPVYDLNELPCSQITQTKIGAS